MRLRGGLSALFNVLDLLQLICISLPFCCNYLHLRFCVHTGRNDSKQQTVWEGHFWFHWKKKTSSVLRTEQVSSVFEFAPLGYFKYTGLEAERKWVKEKKWKHWRQFVRKKASGEYQKDKSNPSNQITSYCGSISVWLGLVLLHISHCRTTINHYRVRDYQFSACVSARYVSAGLLCLRGSTSVFFFLPLIMLWTEAAVSSRLAQPPSHTEGLQYWSDVLRLLFVWPLTLPQPCVAPFSERTWNIVFAKINITAVRLFHIRSNLLQTGCDTCSLSKLEIFSQALYDTDRGNTSFFTGDGSCRGL